MSTSTSSPAELRLPAPRPKAIDVAAALEQVGGDFEFVMTVMRDEFLAKAPDQIAQCLANARLADAHHADATDVAAKEKRDAALKALAFEAHSMKGASATLHAVALSKTCHRLERTAKGVPLDALEPGPGDDKPITFEQRTREIADRFAELEADVADLVAISDVDVAAASEALGPGLGATLARLAGNAAELAASPAAIAATAAIAGGAVKNENTENEPLASLARAVVKDADAVGARALRDAATRMDALVFSLFGDPRTEVEKNHVHVDLEPKTADAVDALIALRAAAQTAAFDCAAVCSFEETAGFVKRAREACGMNVRLVDASARRSDGFFDAAATAAELRRAFATFSTFPREKEKETRATPDSNRGAEDDEQTRVPPWVLPDDEEPIRVPPLVPPVDFPRAVRALDGDVAFAEKMLRTFLDDAETFASKPLGNAGDVKDASRRRLSEEHARDAEKLTETADWLGAPPLRAAIATLLDGDASEHAVRAARRAVRDLRAFADGLESDFHSRGKKSRRSKRRSASFRDGEVSDGVRSSTSSPTLPKKSASTDEVMRSGLYAYSSSSLTNSGGGSADSNEDSDEKSRRGSLGSDAERKSARSSTDSGTAEREFGAYRRRHGSWGGSSGRVSADSAGAAEGAVTALAALSPRARARGLAAIKTPRRLHGALTFDLRRALNKADGDWDFAVGCAGRHAVLAREQIAVLKTVMFADERSQERDEKQIVNSAIAQLRSVAEGASASHAPRLMDAVEALANALVSAASQGELNSNPIEPRSGDKDTDFKTTWRFRSKKLLRSLEKRAEEYVAAVDAVANTSRAFSPQFVFSDACGGDAALAVEKLRVFVLAARDAHVAAVRAVAAAESAFGAEVLGGAFRDERDLSRGPVSEEKTNCLSHSSSDEGDSSARSSPFAFADGVSGARKKKPARGDGEHSTVREILDDVRYGLSGAFGSLEACERLASSLCARPSERAFRGAASRVARIAVEVSAAAAGVDVLGKGRRKIAVPSVPACFLEDEHAQTVAALAALKREVEALAADFHAIAPDAAVPAANGKRGKKENSGGFFSRLFGTEFFFFGNGNRRGNGSGNPKGFDSRGSLDIFLRAIPATAFNAAKRGAVGLQTSLSSENAAVGAATALVASYTVARLCGAFFLASAENA